MTLWRGPTRPILASQSAARQMLLGNAGIDFEAIPADVDERAIQKAAGAAGPSEIAGLLAREKARFVSQRHPGRHVIGADQTLALGTKMFSKPGGRDQAAAQLSELAGKTHELHSAVAVHYDGKLLFEEVSVARLRMRALNGAEIDAYLDAAGESVTSSVGAYQLERLGVHLFDRIEGDHFTILGLPLLPFLDFFRRQGLLAL